MTRITNRDNEFEELLIKNLPAKIKGGNEKENANFWEHPTKVALNKCKFIHYNSPDKISFMIFDIDKIGDKRVIDVYPTIDLFLEYVFEKVGLEPTFITQTQNGYHFAYHLKNWVHTHQRKSLKYLNSIKCSIIDSVGCDINGSVRNWGIWRNPLKHPCYYYSYCINYELRDFHHFPAPKKMIQKHLNNATTIREIDRDILIEGNRNNGLFFLGMSYAKNKKNLFLNDLEYTLLAANNTIEESLPKKEIVNIAKSIFNKYYLKDKIYVQSNKEKRDINEGVMGFEKMKNLSKEEYDNETKKRQSLSAKRTNEMIIDRTSNLVKARKEHKKQIFITNLTKVRDAIKDLEKSGEKVNISKLVRITGLDRKTVKKYFDFPKIEEVEDIL